MMNEAWRRRERDRLIAVRLAVDVELLSRWSGEIDRRLRALLENAAARTIGIYWPHRGEFDPRPLAAQLIENGRLAALPAVIARDAPLEYRLWRPEMAMSPGPYGIAIPEGRQVVTPDLLIVPMVGFDSQNYRLGYGGGYFDRTLAAADPRPMTIGVGFELSRLATIFPAPHDVPMDIIVTEAGLQEKRS